MSQITGITTQTALQRTSNAAEVREAFTDFVGQTFFTQLIKAMRSTQQKPAYFDGGRAEEAFQAQLDQTLAEKMTETTADQIAEPMFRRQFPRQAAELASREQPNQLTALDHLRRR